MKFALAGNPNCGKTTLFNLLTGSTAHVGNWPGVTIDKREGAYKKLPQKADIIDLPGIYSLSPYTPEEIVSREYIVGENPDCVINVVDATNLERNLYLTTQLLELDVPIVVALNMTDVVEKNGDSIDVKSLSSTLGVPVVSVSALKGKGATALMETAYASASKPREGTSVLSESALKSLYHQALAVVNKSGGKNPAFRAVKLIESDEVAVSAEQETAEKVKSLREPFASEPFGDDFEGAVADARYRYISKMCAPAITKKARADMTKSDKIDKVLTHRIWGIPLFLLIMFAVFHLTFSENLLFLGIFIPEGSFDIPVIGTDAINSPGAMLASLMGLGTDSLGGLIGGAMPEGTWYTSLVCDGLLEGLFAVLSFIPQIMVLFLFLAILEDSGYMSRVAFIMDRAFRRFGLSGKAFMPLVMCFGCAVPGIMATRTLEDDAERRRTIMLTPFFSCGAKLPIWAAFAGVFAHAYSGLNAEIIVYSMYLLGIVVAVVSSLLLKKTIVKGDTPPFIMELPAYHMPQAKSLGVHLWQKLKHYLLRAATIIAGAIVVIWFISTFNFKMQMVDTADSMIGTVSKAFTWLFVPLGFGMGENGFKFVVAAFTGLIAKEMVVATMGTFSGIDGDEALETDGGELAETAMGAMMLSIGGVLGGINVAIPAMFAFMAFNLLSVPCMAAVAAASGELPKKRYTLIAVAYWIVCAYVVSMFIFWYGVLWAACRWAALIVTIVLLGGIATVITLKVKGIIGGAKKSLPGAIGAAQK